MQLRAAVIDDHDRVATRDEQFIENRDWRGVGAICCVGVNRKVRRQWIGSGVLLEQGLREPRLAYSWEARQSHRAATLYEGTPDLRQSFDQGHSAFPIVGGKQSILLIWDEGLRLATSGASPLSKGLPALQRAPKLTPNPCNDARMSIRPICEAARIVIVELCIFKARFGRSRVLHCSYALLVFAIGSRVRGRDDVRALVVDQFADRRP